MRRESTAVNNASFDFSQRPRDFGPDQKNRGLGKRGLQLHRANEDNAPDLPPWFYWVGFAVSINLLPVCT